MGGHQVGWRSKPVTTEPGLALAGTAGHQKQWTLLVLLSLAQFMVILDCSLRVSSAKKPWSAS